MKAKVLKDWIALVPDEAVIEGRERDYGSFVKDFQIRATFPILTAEKEPKGEEL